MLDVAWYTEFKNMKHKLKMITFNSFLSTLARASKNFVTHVKIENWDMFIRLT